MEIVAALVLIFIAFLLGWFTGNIVETVLTNRERRLREARIADRNKQMYLEQRSDRG
jgi:hypothetical protein